MAQLFRYVTLLRRGWFRSLSGRQSSRLSNIKRHSPFLRRFLKPFTNLNPLIKWRGDRPYRQCRGRRHFAHYWLTGILALLLTTLLLTAGAPTGQAQSSEPLETAPVVLDGQPLFEVTPYRDSAQERATEISSQLEAWISEAARKRSQNPRVTVETGISPPTILLDGDPLLAVTKTDAIAAAADSGDARGGEGLSPDALSQQWASQIQAALEQAQEERSPDFLRNAIILAAMTCAVVGFMHWWLRRLQYRITAHPLQELQNFLQTPQSGENPETRTPLVNILLSLGLILVRVSLWIAAGFYITNLFPLTRDRSYEIFQTLRESLFSKIFPVGNETYSVTDLIILIGAFFSVILGATVVANLLRSRILRIAGIGSGAQEAIATLTRYTLIAIGSVVVLQIWGLDLSSLTLLASALGVGIGFGFQNIAKDFGSGLVLLFERPIQVGDFIEVDEFMGTVDRIGARSTNIKTLDQISIIVPNSYFLENQVINWSHENPLSRIALPVGVSYSADPEQVKGLLLQAAAEHSGIVRLPRPQVFFKGFGNSALDFVLMVWIVEPNRQPVIKSDLYFRIFALFRQENIEIPFPQRDLHIRSGQLPIDLNPATLTTSSEQSFGQTDANGGNLDSA